MTLIQRLLSKGSTNLQDKELLCLLWQQSSDDNSITRQVDRLWRKHGRLQAICQLNLMELQQIRHLNRQHYGRLQASLEISRRFWTQPMDRQAIDQDYLAVARLLITQLKHHKHETFAVLFLDQQQRIISLEKLFHGSLGCAFVHPRVIIERCLAHNAASIILAHNHPSGRCDPSQADLAITQELQDLLARIDVTLYDHIIVADNKARSLCLTQNSLSGIKSDLFAYPGDKNVQFLCSDREGPTHGQ